MTNKEIELQAEVDNLNHRVAQLEMLVLQLRSTPTQGPTLFPNYPASDKRCSKCGIKMDGPMGYSCPDSECPVFIQVKC